MALVGFFCLVGFWGCFLFVCLLVVGFLVWFFVLFCGGFLYILIFKINQM